MNSWTCSRCSPTRWTTSAGASIRISPRSNPGAPRLSLVSDVTARPVGAETAEPEF
ncbi:hypothetical protein ACWDZ8_36480 [Streptomyces sp. NPDC003233]